MRILVVVALLTAIAASAQTPAAQTSKTSPPPISATTQEKSSARLPVRRVVLYKNGVGYFEHSGRVRGNQDITIDFTSAQLNDVLKSLTVLDLGGGRVSGVSYNSTAPLSTRLKALRLPLGEDITLGQFLVAIRGSRVEVRSGGTAVTGRLLGVEDRERPGKDDQVTRYQVISVVTDGGEVRSWELTPALSVRVAERDLNEEVGRYLTMIASAREQDVRRMQIATTGNGDRELFASYISEVPVWKSTYRIVLPTKEGAKPILQGWAIVDNTVGEDWSNVELALVAGAPQSFVENLSQPFYARRPVVQMRESAMLTPQTHEGTVAAQDEESDAALRSPAVVPHKVAVIREDAPEEQASAGVVGGVIGGVMGGPMAKVARPGVGAGSGGGIGSGSGAGIGGANFAIANALANQRFETASRDIGDLYEYKLKEPVTIRKNQSALVPILQANVGAEQVTLWSENRGLPLRALWLDNTSGLTLDSGAFNIIEQNTFAGEGLLAPIKPGEKRLLSYAVDQGVRVNSTHEHQRERTARLRINRGVLIETVESREHRTYTVRNENDKTRTVVLEHPANPNMKFAKGSAQPDETSQNFHRFRVVVEPKKTTTVKVSEYQPVSSTYALTNMGYEQIEYFLKSANPSAEVEQALRRVLAQKRVIGDLDIQIRSSRSQMDTITGDQARVRENMKALKGSAEEKSLIARYTRQLNEQEDQMDALRKSTADLQKKREQEQFVLNKMLDEMTIESGD